MMAAHQGEEGAVSEKKELKEGRPYQVKLVEFALKENTIVSLGTGAGKTFVAVMLIRELSHETLGPFTEEEGKRIVFLAHTVPLVKQQAEYIRDNTTLKVSDFIGDAKGIDNWPKETWYRHFNANNVLVFSRAIFLDLLTKAFIRPRQLKLIVFDECHHATKNDPFVQIMKVVKDAPEDERPRVLGLSASLLGQKVRPGELDKGVKGLESILMSRARTAPDLSDVVKYATNPEEKITNFSSKLDDVASALKRILAPPLNFLQTKIKGRKGKYSIEETAKNLLDDLHHILIDLGAASASDFVQQTIKELRKALAYSDPEDLWEKQVGLLVLSQLLIFETKCREYKAKYGGKLQDSKKVQAMLLEIADAAVRSGASESSDDPNTKKDVQELRGIIFTERRHTASCLAKLIQEKSRSDPELRHISCDFVVGHNVGQNATSMRKEARMKSRKQDLVLSKFRKGRVNLLIATSVIEEGVDVPRCNLVIRFDLPQNFRAYIQSKGRARDKPSCFLLLIGDDQSNYKSDIDNYHVLEKELIELCQSDRKLPTEEEIQAKMAELVPPYMPNGRDGARATVGNSLTLLHRYCNRLPHDEYTKLCPSFEVIKIPKLKMVGRSAEQCLEEEEEDPNFDYVCSLRLPMNCPVKKVIKTQPLGSKLQSQRAAALYAIEELHKLKEVDDLFKATPAPDTDDEEIRTERKIPGAGTDKRSTLFKTDIPSVLSKCLPQPDSSNYLYVFVVREAVSKELYVKDQAVGLLTRKPLPYWMVPQYCLHVKDTSDKETVLEVTLQMATTHPTLAAEELTIYKDCHRAIFTDILLIQSQELTLDFDSADRDYIIVPVTINSTDGKHFSSATIDFDTACEISSRISEKRKPEKPYSVDELEKSLVFTAHREPIGLLEIFKVQVDSSVTPRSQMTNTKYQNYYEFFKGKYGFELTDLEQPGLTCTRVNTSFLKLFTKRYFEAEPASKSASSIIMFPEQLYLFPVGTSFWRLLRCLPALLWRLESLLLANELAEEIRQDTRIGNCAFDTTILTDTVVRGYSDAGYGELRSKMYRASNDVAAVPEMTPLAADHRYDGKRGPDSGLILQSLTPRGANDSVNLERLEILGDSLLKLATSVYLFNTREKDHEGRLSEARSRRVSNVNLFCLGRKRNIASKILSNDFNMGGDGDNVDKRDRVRWIPPGYSILMKTPPQVGVVHPFEEKYKYHRVTDKGVADSVEALIGAHTVAGGLEGGIAFMKWLGIKLEIPNDRPTSGSISNRSLETLSSNLLFGNSSHVFRSHFGGPPISFIPIGELTGNKDRLISQVAVVQRKINYNFKNDLLLIEAMTHPSYAKNTITDCYQRLEFLGDAILDYLVTCHIYLTDPKAEPGLITSLRSALVCNTQFAELALSLDLHKSLLHSSPPLFKDIGKHIVFMKEQRAGSLASSSLFNDFEKLSLSEEKEESEEPLSVSEDDVVEEDDDSLNPPKCLSDCFEALAGAVFIDSDMSLQSVWQVFSPMLEPLLETFRSKPPTTAISELYKRTKPTVKKQTLRNHMFRCVIEIPELDICVESTSRSYKNAKNSAAFKALESVIASK